MGLIARIRKGYFIYVPECEVGIGILLPPWARGEEGYFVYVLESELDKDT
jgi:hypothetical protein